MRHTLLLIALLVGAAGLVRADADAPLLLQKPTLSKSHIAFNYAGDLWVVGRDGGEARRLTSGAGLEYGPHFSPDGSQVAFTGEYDGNLDVYVIPTVGGEPKRLTFHPGVDVALGWTPDGTSVLFSSGRTSYSRFNKLFTVPANGDGLPTELPLPMGEQGAFTPDGSRIAYVPYWNRRATPDAYIAWKNYRGGKASPIWIATLADSRIEKVPRTDSSDFCPTWLDGKLYFLSDRNGPVTLFSYDPDSKQVQQVLENKGLDLYSAAAGPDAIVYEQFGSLHVFDPKDGKARKVDVRIAADFPGVRPRYEKVGRKIVSAAVSPTGVRAVFEARGEILTVPAEKGDVRNLTQTPGTAERDPAWSPDGKTIAYFSDESGEYKLHLKDARGAGQAKQIKLGDAGSYYFHPVWSPDSKKIAYADNRQKLWVVDVDSGQSTPVDHHAYFSGPDFDAAWSPDSRWLAYTKVLTNRLRAAYLFDTKDAKATQITDGMSDVRHTAFDKGGKYVYFTASTDVGPTTNGIDMSGMNRPVTRSVYLAVLDKSIPSPLAPESDEEKEEKEAASGGGNAPGARGGAERRSGERTGLTKIDLDGIGHRVLALPVPARDYMSLQAGKSGTLFLVERPNLPPGGPPAGGRGGLGGATVTKFDLSTRKSDPVLSGVRTFMVTFNGEKALYQQGERWVIASVGSLSPNSQTAAPAAAGSGRGGRGGRGGAAPSSSSGDGVLKTDDMEVHVDPRAEWRQMYREAWRLQRDFFYAPNFHGLDLDAAERQYAKYLGGIAHRTDLNYLFNEMLGQLSVGHMYVSGGDTPEVPRVRGGLLGADYKVENGRYRFAHVYGGENWNPQLRAPLTQPGVNVKAGEYLLAVNGKELTAADNPYRALESTAGKAVTLKVGPNPDGSNAREVTAVPVESEVQLRNISWVEDNRRKVEKMSGGRVAYVYMPDTGFGGYANFNRYFFAQVDKDALVLDERFNGGGKAADYVIDYLRRELLNYWTAREGKTYETPGGAIYGPKAMVINEFAGSGGDAMPWYFRHAKLGPLVGKRTWGGLVGISGYPPLLDGGSVTSPSFAAFGTDGKWDVENHGVAPDVEVELDPYEVRQGRDPQLERAVELVLEALKRNPPQQPHKPPYPNYHPNGADRRTGGGR
jgi:tricorn protease